VSVEFDLTGPLPEGLMMIEASAGTGKTYTLVALALRSIAEDDVAISSLCLVTFTEAATAEMRGRLRIALSRALAHLTSDAAEHDDTLIDVLGRDLARRPVYAARLERALAELDTAWITTLHGWCARVLASSGMWNNQASRMVHDAGDVDEVLHDILIARYAASGDLPAPVKAIRQAVVARLAMPLARLQRLEAAELDPKATAAKQRKWAEAVEGARRCDETVELVDDIVADIRQRRRRQRRQTFDGLLIETRDLLMDTQRSDVVGALRDRFDVVLIDEFQDTDQIQWDIFRRAFLEPLSHHPSTIRRMVLVGDPKQSIYRFRAAELSAYLAARRHAVGRLRTLTTNRRSDPALLAGLERLLAGTTFGDDDVVFEPVKAPTATPPSRIHGPQQAALEFRLIEDTARDTGSLRRAVRHDVTATVIELLAGSTWLDDARSPAGRRLLRPADIAILTRSNADAAATALQLSAAGIPAATAGSSSVLESDAGVQWRVLLDALVRPSRLGSARAVATGWFMGLTLEELAHDHGDEILRTPQGRDVIDVLQTWSVELQRGGVPALVSMLSHAGWHQRLLGRVDGERHVTDVDHIAELLHAATAGRPTSAAAALQAFEDLASTAEQRVTAELLARRIDRDDDAVQVVTIHKAKGLEFPVVLCPSMWGEASKLQGVAHASVGGVRYVDTTGMFPLSDAMKRIVAAHDIRAADKLERFGEDLRLLYVALTRAKHRCIVWWAEPAKASAALHTIVDGLGGPRSLAESSQGLIQAVVAPARTAGVVVESGEALPPWGEVAVASRIHDRQWRIWSFSAIKATADDATQSPTGGGVDEVDLNGSDTTPVGVVTEEQQPAVRVTALSAAPGGTRFGTAVHRIFERFDFADTGPQASEALRHLCRSELAHIGGNLSAERLARALEDVLAVPLGGPGDLGPLSMLERRDRLDELDFHLPLGATNARELVASLLDHLDAHDPARPWAQLVVDGALCTDLEGRLTGSIDLVARHGTDQQVWIADYKTNRLGPSNGLDPGELHAVMTHSHYWLQAALYLVATHRYLRQRRSDYDPDRHLIGAAYLFVRAMTPDEPGSGVVWWRPSTAALDAMDTCLHPGRAS
jgi:exodeoxyribonuclease V beta subunit